MFNSGSSRNDRKNSDDVHRQSSRTTGDDLVLAVDTNDLLESETISNDQRTHRRSDNSRREQTSKRSQENNSSQHRSSRYSSPPAPISSKRHHSSQRTQRSSRPNSTLKRSRSRSRSPHERPQHRSRTQQNEENSSSKKTLPFNESADLSVISEDETTKPTDQRSSRTKVENSSTPVDRFSSSSFSQKQVDVRETNLDTSQTATDYDLSLFPNSILSASLSSTPTATATPNELLQAIDLLSKYKTMRSIPSADPLIVACEKEILQIIQKKIDLQKKETQINERAMNLRELEIAEREKQFQPATTTTIVEPMVTEEKILPVEPMEKVEESSTTISTETKNENLSDDSTRSTRKNGGKSRFSAANVEPNLSISPDETEERIPSIQLELASNEGQPTISLMDAELKVISTNSCRKVEIQSASSEKKNSSDDLRYTISKNRSKQIDNGENAQQNESNGNRYLSDDEQKITINQIIPSSKDEKSSNLDFHSQRSFPSTDNTDDKRRTQQRQNRRQQTYSNERSNFSTSQSSRYASNSKRYENEDLRSHLHETKTSKSSRTNYRNNH